VHPSKLSQSTSVRIFECYKDVQSSLQILSHYLEQRSTDVMHLVKKLEKFDKEIDHLHVNQLQQTSIDAFFHPRGVEMEE
jgi:hypothetical protein